MKRLTTFILLSLMLMITSSAFATHITGMNITYKRLPGNVYEFKVVTQRDCRGVPTSTISLTMRAKNNIGYAITLPLSRVSINDITPYCSSVPVQCNPVNTYGTGTGFEEQVFVGRFDFDTGVFAQSPWDTACEIILATGQCCRSSSITTGQANDNYYTEVWFNKCVDNSSPVTSGENIYMIYCQYPFTRYMTNVDADGDSLSYKLAPQYSNSGVTIQYDVSTNCGKYLSAENPLSCFQPTPCSPKAPSPNNDPPIGFYFDSLNAFCAFTPINCNELTTVTYVVSEHRKDNNGAYSVIGQYRKDFTIYVLNSPVNNPPKIVTQNTYNAVAGKPYELFIPITDNPVVPPPPAQTQSPDTVDVYWDSGIANATLTVTDTSRIPSVRFNWNPSCSMISNEPYEFIITATDRFCPVPAVSQKRIRIKVIDPNKVSLGADINVCEGTKSRLEPVYEYKEYLWSTNDTNEFIEVTNPGVYSLRAISFCGDTTYDTVEVIHHAKPIVQLPVDTGICIHDSFNLIMTSPNALFTIWNDTDTLDTFNVNKAGDFKVALHDEYCGVFTDYIKVGHINYPLVNLGTDKHYCKSPNRLLQVNADSIVSVNWSTGATNNSITATVPGKYWVTVNTLCGMATDTVDFSDTTKLNVDLGPDTFLCDDGIELISNESAHSYLWSNGKATRAITVTESGIYVLRVSKCTKIDFDTIVVAIDHTPVVDLGMDIETDSPFSITLDAGIDSVNYLWSTNETTKTISVTEPGNYWVRVTNNCGNDADTVNVSVLVSIGPNPIAENIQVYPNPASSNVTISFTNADPQQVYMKLMSASGEVIYQDKLEVAGTMSHSINLSELPSGIYFIQLTSAKGTATIRLVVK